MEIAHFKREQEPGIFHYYRVYGGPGKTEYGFQTVINLLNRFPIIHTEQNDINSLTGTWCLYEIGTPINVEEFLSMLSSALDTVSDAELATIYADYSYHYSIAELNTIQKKSGATGL